MVEMQGLVSEIDGMTSITQPIILNVLSNSSNLPYYTWITADELDEAWEGVYLSILHAECTAINGTEWNIQDSTGTATVGDFCYTSSPAVGSTYNLIGIGSETADGYRFNPRSAGDLQAPPIVTISDIQQTANGQTGPSPYMGQDVTFSGIVTQCYQNRIYVQDAPGAWNGIPVYADMPYEIGDHVTVSGIVNEPAGMTMIMVVRALQKNSSGNPLPAAASITTADLDEPWEGVLITMDNAECTAINGDEWEINDGSGPAIVGNLFYGATPEIGSLYRVSGVADQASTGYRINPRNTDDVEPLGPFDVTIAQIQQTATGQAGPSPYEDLEVTFDGVVTYRSMNSYFVQDGAGPWNGVMVSQFFNGVAAGDSITVTGMVTESNGMTTITQPAAIVHASGATLPAPVMITNADLAEAYEGVLIAVNDAECVAINGNEWDIDDATAIATVGAYCHVASPTIGTAYNVTGIGNETADGYRINPRNADDVVESFSYQYDLEALSLTGPQYALYNQATEYIMNIQNNGSEMATGYTVDFLVNGSAVYSTPGSTLQSGESMDYSFFWTPDTTSTFEVASKIVYALDEKPSNNMSNILDVISITQNGSQVVQVGNAGTYSFSRLPANLDNDYNLSQQLFYQDELQTSGRLANIKFFTRFEVADVIEPMKIWMAETDETSLANGWIPFSEFTLVYDGMVAYPFMEGSVVIDLDAPFEYSGNHNLVMMVQINKQYPTPYYWCDYYYTDTPDHPDRSLFLTSQDPFNVVTPPAGETRAQHSNVGLYFWTQQTGSLEGVITDASNQPMPCVEVSFGPDFFTTETDANGAYFFPYVFEGTEDVTASIYGYYDNIQTVTIQPDQANYCDFVMTELPKVTVTGQLVANYDPAVTIANAEISLSGYQNYSTTSDANGFFSIDEVYADKEYTFAASADLFQDYSQMVVVPASNYDMGQVVMDESPIQPGNIFAQEQPNGDNLVQWTLPGQGYPEYEIAYDHNFPTSAMHWTELGGECAVRFTPFGYPCTVTGGSVNIWDGSWPQGVQLLPFDIAVYDDDGITPNPNVPDDFPGTELARITVTPDAFGWVTFDFSDENIVLEDGDFYISFIQTAQAPQAPPIAVDSLDPAYHNYIMYPGSTWMGFTEYYNDFMIRALVEGPGTNQFNPQPRQLMPVALSGKEQNCIQMAPSTATCIPQEQPRYRHDDNTDSVENYNLYRMAVGDEYTPAAWTQLASAISDTFYVDTQWATLADDTYRYAVQAIYYNGVPSVYTFSDSVEKGLTTSLVCNLSTNSGEDTEGTELLIIQQDGDHNYQYTVPAGNSITVPAIYKGTYTIKAYLSEFEDYLATDVAITEPTTLSIELQEIIYQITNLQAQDAGDDIQLSWNWQGPSSVLFVDDDGSFNHPGCFDTQPLYTALLDTLGITYDVMELTIDMGDGPTAAEMMPYDLVIWETGEHYSDSRTLTVNDELNLATYLDAGGRLLLSAQDYLWDRYPEMFNLFPGDFPFEYLGVWGCAQDQVLVGSMPNGVPQATLFGAPESFIEGLSVGIIDVFTPPTDDGVFIDVLVPQDDASSYAKIDGHAVAVKTRNTIFTTASIASMVDGANRVADILNGSTRGFFIPSLFRTFQSFTISRDGEVIAEDVTELSFVDEDVIDGTYTYEVVANFTTASSAPISITVEVTGHTSAHNGMAPVPTALNGNYPNPFNPETTISYSLQQESDVTLAIYNARGQLVRTLVDSHQDAGSYSARWDGTDNSQKTVASGIYFYRMNTETYQKTRKMILLK
jgi:archaellum component FlaF (FlaF/FlaG flagellin family)